MYVRLGDDEEIKGKDCNVPTTPTPPAEQPEKRNWR
jgi:hypothetical protein